MKPSIVLCSATHTVSTSRLLSRQVHKSLASSPRENVSPWSIWPPTIACQREYALFTSIIAYDAQTLNNCAWTADCLWRALELEEFLHDAQDEFHSVGDAELVV